MRRRNEVQLGILANAAVHSTCHIGNSASVGNVQGGITVCSAAPPDIITENRQLIWLCSATNPLLPDRLIGVAGTLAPRPLLIL